MLGFICLEISSPVCRSDAELLRLARSCSFCGAGVNEAAAKVSASLVRFANIVPGYLERVKRSL